MRSGPWKLHLPRKTDSLWSRYSIPADSFDIPEALLYHLTTDIAETTNVATQNPDVVIKLLQLAEHARTYIGDTDRIGQNARFFDSAPCLKRTKWTGEPIESGFVVCSPR